MFSITIQNTSFKLGPFEIPYASVTGAGIGLARRRWSTHRKLLIGFRMPGAARSRCISFGLRPGAEGAELEETFRARVPDRWHGEGPYYAMRKRLGFSDRWIAITVGAITLVTVVAVVAWAVTQGAHHKPAPSGSAIKPPLVYRVSGTAADGARYVSDGAVILRAELVDGTAAPAGVTPLASEQIATILETAPAQWFALDSLVPAAQAATVSFHTPDGVALSDTNVRLLRGLPGRIVLGTTGLRSVVLIKLDDELVGAVMPLAP